MWGTSTFVFIYSPTDVRKYFGNQKTKEGLVELRIEGSRPFCGEVRSYSNLNDLTDFISELIL